MEKPNRRYMLTLKIGADDMKSLIQSLDSIAFDLEGWNERAYQSISGSPSAGTIVDLEFHPDVTHDSYHEQLRAYLAEREQQNETK
jgi:pyruvate-formate lyase-activating enzyme